MNNITLALWADKETSNNVNICTMKIAEMFGRTHTKMFNLITSYVTVNAGNQEKEEFRFEEWVYKQGVRKHAVYYLTENGGQHYT